MSVTANNPHAASPRLLMGFSIAVLAHLVLFTVFPSLAPTKMIEVALQSSATMLHISIAPIEEPKPTTAPQATYTPPVVKPKSKRRWIEKTAPQPRANPQSTVKPVIEQKNPIAKAKVPTATVVPAKTLQPKIIPTTTSISLRGRRIPPAYPKRALRMKQEGTVMLKVLVDKQGGQKEVQLARSSTFPLLDRAALEAVRQWRFNPTTRGDEAIISWVQVPVEFRIR